MVQSLIAAIDSLQQDNDWRTLTLEPSEDQEKVDLLWKYDNGRRKVVQVKSSVNQINKSDAERWARALEQNVTADSYELVLIGPSAQSVVEMEIFGQVSIAPPFPPKLHVLIDHAAQSLGRFLRKRGCRSLNTLGNEVLIRALVTRFLELSTTGSELARSVFEDELMRWVDEIYGLSRHPHSVPFTEQVVDLTPAEDDIKISRKTVEVRALTFWASFLCASLLCLFAINYAAEGAPVWVLLLGVGTKTLWKRNREYLELARSQALNAERGWYLGSGRIAQRNADGDFVVSRLSGKCIFPGCDKGWLRVTAPPPRAQPHQLYVAVCDQCGKDHSYVVLPNGKASPEPKMDWRSLAPRQAGGD